MLPGISAEDCLFADLGVDPAEAGWQSYEATGSSSAAAAIEPRAALVLWQVDGVGKLEPTSAGAQALAARRASSVDRRARARLLPRVDVPEVVVDETSCVRRRRSSLMPRRRSAAPPLAGRRSTARALGSLYVPRPSSYCPGAVGGDDVALRLVEPSRALDALAGLRPRGLPSASTTASSSRTSPRRSSRVGRLDDRERLPRDAAPPRSSAPASARSRARVSAVRAPATRCPARTPSPRPRATNARRPPRACPRACSVLGEHRRDRGAMADLAEVAERLVAASRSATRLRLASPASSSSRARPNAAVATASSCAPSSS